MLLRKILVALAFGVSATAFTPGATAGGNIWTDLFPHPTRWDGYRVTCPVGSRRCKHVAPPLFYRKEGLLYRTSARVVRLGKGYGLQVKVAVTVVDGRRHGLYGVLVFQGSMSRIINTHLGSWGFGGGVLLPNTMPQIRPGQRRLSRADYPFALRGSGVLPDHRFKLRVSVSGVTHYAPRRSRTAFVAVVVLEVPLRGPPRIRFKRPTL